MSVLRVVARLAAVSLLWVCSSRAQPEPDGFSNTQAQDAPAIAGPELSARSGYAAGFGRIEASEPLRGTLAGAVPLWLDVGYRVNQRWLVGLYGHYGLGVAGATSRSRCDGCQHTWARFGVQAQYRVFAARRSNVWIGLGVGREVLNTSIDEFAESSRSLRGWEIMNLQLGSEVQPASGVGIGPFVGFSLDSFVTQIERCRDEDLCPVAEREVESSLSGVHGWVNAGLRIVLLP